MKEEKFKENAEWLLFEVGGEKHCLMEAEFPWGNETFCN
jgi:hypothetical protein